MSTMKRKLSYILARKSGPVITIQPERSLREAAQTLCKHRMGALVVVDDLGKMQGIISERDLMRAVAEGFDFDSVLVETIMTTRLIVAVEDDELNHVMNTMTKRRIRHLPVLRGGKLIGMVSIGDVVNTVRVEEERELRDLSDYVQGKYW